jgi:hypothetical protein
MHISEVTPTIVTTGKPQNSNTIVTIVSSNRGEKYQEADRLFDMLSDLVSDTWKPWYCHHFHRLGRERTLVLAAQARVDGFDKRKLFSHLLKETVK